LDNGESESALSFRPHTFPQADPLTNVFSLVKSKDNAQLLSLSSKLLYIDGCSADLFVKMMKASHSFGLQGLSCNPRTMPKDIPVRTKPNTAWIGTAPEYQTVDLESVMADMALSTCELSELYEVETLIPGEFHVETTFDSLLPSSLAHHNLLLKTFDQFLLMGWKDRVNEAMKREMHASLRPLWSDVNMAKRRTNILRNFFILEDSRKLSFHDCHSSSENFRSEGVMISYQSLRMVDASNVLRGALRTGWDLNSVAARFHDTIHTGIIQCDGESQNIFVQPDDGSDALKLQCKNSNCLSSKEKFLWGHQRIAYRIIWSFSPNASSLSSSQMQRVAVPL
jgi:hypothetical protein